MRTLLTAIVLLLCPIYRGREPTVWQCLSAVNRGDVGR